jgi:hypothetical protein
LGVLRVLTWPSYLANLTAIFIHLGKPNCKDVTNLYDSDLVFLQTEFGRYIFELGTSIRTLASIFLPLISFVLPLISFVPPLISFVPPLSRIIRPRPASVRSDWLSVSSIFARGARSVQGNDNFSKSYSIFPTAMRLPLPKTCPQPRDCNNPSKINPLLIISSVFAQR